MGDQRKEGQTGSPTVGADAITGLSRLGVLDAMNSRKHGRGYVVLFYRKGSGGLGLVHFSHDRNGASYKRISGVAKG